MKPWGQDDVIRNGAQVRLRCLYSGSGQDVDKGFPRVVVPGFLGVVRKDHSQYAAGK